MPFFNSAPGIGSGPGTQIPIDSGVFIPEFLDSALDPNLGQTYVHRSANYIKVDDVVFVSIDILMSSFGSLSQLDRLSIGGLPFVVAPGVYSQAYSGFGEGLTASTRESIAGRFIPGTTLLEVNRWSSATGTESINLNFISANGHIQFSGAYFV